MKSMWRLSWLICVVTLSWIPSGDGDILMVTMSGTKSHKIPFWEVARGLIRKGHNITMLTAFPPDFHLEGLEEVTPASMVFYVRNFTDMDMVGNRIRGEEPISLWDIFRFGYEVCEAMYSDHETQALLQRRTPFDLIILDGAFPECALGFVYQFKVPFIYINTVGFFSANLAIAGSPTPYSVTPFFGKSFTDNMNLIDRGRNAFWHLTTVAMHSVVINFFLHPVLKNHFGANIPNPYEMSKNVSLILQNGHFSVSYPRPYLPNVVEIACVHCKPAKPVNKELEEFIQGSGDAGFIYVSMGSSVKAASMPVKMRRLLVRTLSRLPQRVLWKYEGTERDFGDLPTNIKLSKWLPQQDLLGHQKIRAFVTHGGLLSMYETVYHGVPIVSMPVFCDHDSNSAKAEADGYAKVLELSTITSEQLYRAITEIINKPSYRTAVKKRQKILRDQIDEPIHRSVYWIEYVLRHNGAYHLQSPAKDLNYIQYHMFDVMLFSILVVVFVVFVVYRGFKFAVKRSFGTVLEKQITMRSKAVIKKQL